MGAGSTHHFAFAVESREELDAWRDYLRDRGVPSAREVFERGGFARSTCAIPTGTSSRSPRGLSSGGATPSPAGASAQPAAAASARTGDAARRRASDVACRSSSAASA